MNFVSCGLYTGHHPTMKKEILTTLKDIRALLFYLLILIVSCVLVVFTLYKVVDFFIPDKEKYVVASDWVDTIGVVSRLMDEPDFTYWHHGKKYDEGSHVGVITVGVQLGEKHRIKINPKYPECYMPIAWQPVFEDGEKRINVIGTVVNVCDLKPLWLFWGKQDSLNYRFELIYKYTLSGKEYERGQVLPPDFDNAKSNIKSGSRYEVEVSEENKSRAIIHVDRPVEAVLPQ